MLIICIINMFTVSLVQDLVVLGVIILALDAVFLYSIKDKFARQVLLLQGTAMKVNVVAAGLCYLLIIAGLYYFIIRHVIVGGASDAMARIQNIGLKDAMKRAFFLGVVVYGVYDTTSAAVLRIWDPMLALTDTLWGGALFAGATYLFHLYKKHE